MKRWGVFLLWLGIGAMLGVLVGEAAALGGLVVAGTGLLLVVLGSRPGGRSRDLVGDAMEARAGQTAAPAGRPDRPTLAGLGARVEQILSLAERQAADHVAQAKIEADGILANARAEAERIRSNASPAE